MEDPFVMNDLLEDIVAQTKKKDLDFNFSVEDEEPLDHHSSSKNSRMEEDDGDSLSIRKDPYEAHSEHVDSTEMKIDGASSSKHEDNSVSASPEPSSQNASQPERILISEAQHFLRDPDSPKSASSKINKINSFLPPPIPGELDDDDDLQYVSSAGQMDEARALQTAAAQKNMKDTISSLKSTALTVNPPPMSGMPMFDTANETIDKLSQDNKQLREKNARLVEMAETQEKRLDDLEKALNDAQSHLSLAQQKLTQKEQTILELRAQLRVVRSSFQKIQLSGDSSSPLPNFGVEPSAPLLPESQIGAPSAFGVTGANSMLPSIHDTFGYLSGGFGFSKFSNLKVIPEQYIIFGVEGDPLLYIYNLEQQSKAANANSTPNLKIDKKPVMQVDLKKEMTIFATANVQNSKKKASSKSQGEIERILITATIEDNNQNLIKIWAIPNSPSSSNSSKTHQPKEVLSLKVHKKPVRALCVLYVLQNGSLQTFLFSGDDDGIIRQWDITPNQGNAQYLRLTLNCEEKNAGKKAITALALNPQEDILFSGNAAGNIYIWKYSETQCVKRVMNAHEGMQINSFQFHEQLCILVSGGADNIIKFYDVQQKKSQVQAIEPKQKSGFFNFFSSFVSSGNEINGENVPKAFKCEILAASKEHDYAVRQLALLLSPDPNNATNYLISCSEDRKVKVLDFRKLSSQATPKKDESNCIGTLEDCVIDCVYIPILRQLWVVSSDQVATCFEVSGLFSSDLKITLKESFSFGATNPFASGWRNFIKTIAPAKKVFVTAV